MNYKIILWKNNKIHGYTNTINEADDICNFNHEYTFSKKKITNTNKDKYENLTLYNIHDFHNADKIIQSYKNKKKPYSTTR